MSFLQVTNPDLNQAVDQLTKSTIEIAEAASNYGALKVIFGIFIVIVAVLILYFIYQQLRLSSKIDLISVAAHKTQDYFEGASNHTIGVSQGQVLVRRALNSLATSTKYSILRIKLENHIENTEAVKIKVGRLVRNEYAELNSFFSNFICNDHPLNDVLNESDITELETLILEQVYIPKDEFSVFLMDQAVDIYINGIKLLYIKNL